MPMAKPCASSQKNPAPPASTSTQPNTGSDLPRPRVASGASSSGASGQSQVFSPWISRNSPGA